MSPPLRVPELHPLSLGPAIIQFLIPQRRPFLMVDRLLGLSLDPPCLHSCRFISANDPVFGGHFPSVAIQPGALTLEGMAQTAGILVGQARDFKEKVILAKISKVEVTEPVLPGDQVKFRAEIQTLADQAASTHGTVFKNGREIGTIDLMFSHIDQNLAGMKFPEENFVFTGQFLRLIAGFVDPAGGEAPGP